MRILNLGGGVQSTTVFLMSHEGTIPPIEYAIFADTQEEPESVYNHLDWLKTVPPPVPFLLTGTIGSLGEHLLTGRRAGRADRIKSNGERFATIPAFTAENHNTRQGTEVCEGRTPRQCTKEYKTEVVEKIIRREIFGLKPRHHMPKNVKIEQLFGISYDERSRAARISLRVEATGWGFASFPLIEMHMNRQDCKDWLQGRVPHEVPRSACVFCPFKSAAEWQETKRNPTDWARAVEIDKALRTHDVENRQLDKSLYIHRKCIPLEMVDIEAEAARYREKKRTPLFEIFDCGEGMCGL